MLTESGSPPAYQSSLAAAGGMLDGQLAPQPGMGQGGVERPPEPEIIQLLDRWAKSPNIALEMEPGTDYPDIDESELARMGMRVKLEYDIDKNSRADWLTKTKDAMDLAMQIAQPKIYPWPKASNVIFPLMTTASMQFAARAYPAIVASKGIAKGTVIGDDSGRPKMVNGQPVMGPNGAPVWEEQPGAKQLRATRVGEHMSYQLMDEQPEWEVETDLMLVRLPMVGCEFRKSYFDPAQGRNASLLVSAMNLVVNYKAKSLEKAPRITEIVELYPLEIKERERAGTFREITYTNAPDASGDDDAPQIFLEQHRWWDLDGDDFPEPYIVTVHEMSARVVRIVARYDLDSVKYNATRHKIVRIEPIHFYTKYDFIPNPDGGIYGVGFGQLLKPINESINTTLNMLIDAGHLANTGGGFIGKGLSMNAGSLRFQPGEYKQVNATGATVRESIVPLNMPGPNTVLFSLLGMLVEAGKEIAAIQNVLSGDADTVGANASPTTVLALIEEGMKVYTWIYKRVHRSLKAELQKLYALNRKYLNEETSYRIGSDWKTITREDYEKGAGVEPVSDPTMVTNMQKLGRAQILLPFKDDTRMNFQEITTRLFEAAAIDNIEKLYNPNPQPPAELQMEKLKLQLRERHDEALIEGEKAKALLSRAQAVLAIANADKAVNEQGVAWAEQQLAAIQMGIEALNDQDMKDVPGAQPPSNPPLPPAALPAALGGPPSPPPVAGLPMIHPYHSAPAHGSVHGARRAPDGNYYLPDGSRPGKFMRVNEQAQAA